MCEKCNKLIPENLNYCPTCKMNELKKISPIIDLRTNTSLVSPKNVGDDIEIPMMKEKQTSSAIADNQKTFGFLVMIVLLIGFVVFMVINNDTWSIFNNNDYQNINQEPPFSEIPIDFNSDEEIDNEYQPNNQINIPVGYSLYRYQLSDYFNLSDNGVYSLYFITDEIHGYLIRNVRISVMRDQFGITILNQTDIPAFLDILLPNEYILLIEKMSHIYPKASLLMINEDQNLAIQYLQGYPSSTDEIKVFIRERAS